MVKQIKKNSDFVRKKRADNTPRAGHLKPGQATLNPIKPEKENEICIQSNPILKKWGFLSVTLFLAFTATSASAEGVKTKVEKENGILKLTLRADTTLLPRGAGDYTVEVRFLTQAADGTSRCDQVMLTVDPVVKRGGVEPQPFSPVREATMKLTDDNEIKVKILFVPPHPMMPVLIATVLTTTDPATGGQNYIAANILKTGQFGGVQPQPFFPARCAPSR